MDRMAEELPHEVAKEDKRVALLISVLALSLAIVETGANSAQTEAISGSVQTTDTWSFYQARTIRQTTVRTAAELAELTKPDDDPKGGDGRKQLAERARLLEGAHETAMARYHLYEYGAALIQVAIVVASASIITAVPLLTVGSIVLGLGGAALGLIGWLAPQAVHF
jgi:hypothetical protein